jgi:flagellar hook-associated protein 1
MASLFAVLDVARDGMLAQATALDITGQNVSNASTPGYARRVANLETVASTGAFGSVRVASIGRVFDRFAAGRAVGETGKQGAAVARGAALANAEAILTPSGVPGISDRMSDFYGSLATLGQSPSDPSVRASALAAADNLAQSVSSTAGQLAAAQASLLGKAQGVAGEVNERLSRIAALNRQIAQATGAGSMPADLMDQRDTLIREVGERVGAQAIEQPNGEITLLSSGTALVDGDKAGAISVEPDPNGALLFKLTRPSGAVDDITSHVTTGTLGGIREARDVDIQKTINDLDQLAFDLATSVNAVHVTGYGLDGQTGRPLFDPPTQITGAARAMAVSPVVLGNPLAIATTSTAAGLPGGNDVAVALSQLSQQPLSGAPTPAHAFASVAAGLGTARQSAEAEIELRAATVAQADNLRESAQGVSLDEEMVNLTRFQRAFEASMRVLRTVDELLDGLVKGL